MSMVEEEVTHEHLHAAMRARKVAGERYLALIIQAKEQGWSNSRIARAVGLSEAAIRLMLLRRDKAA